MKLNEDVFHVTFQNCPWDQTDTSSTGVLRRASPTHCPGVNGQMPGGLMHLDIRNPGKQAELANGFRMLQGQIIPPAERQPLPSSHIPVPRNRYQSSMPQLELWSFVEASLKVEFALWLQPYSGLGHECCGGVSVN